VPLPSVDLAASSGEKVNLAKLEGRAIVFGYPYIGKPGRPDPEGWDDIAGAHGSSAQAAAIAALGENFCKAGYAVFGLTLRDRSETVEASDRLGLPFPLLTDAGGRFCAALGLPTFAAGGECFLTRVTLVTAGGDLTNVVYPVHPPDRHPGELLRRLQRC